MHLITSKLDQNIIHKLDKKLNKKWITRSKRHAIYLDVISYESLWHLITFKLDQNIIHKLEQKWDLKRINRLKLDAI